ncbi:agamous-like MADS-box protein AGL62 [Rhodamnia argentea]|uniref:Agamous-like MADS-box protein AGL62 n=1 Tax=Rhodamnia argentea TaxID=178133 RepID=A0ABM3GYP3_9MYRT|nr:agamous-like MADS-box protein AGL62 [Rhodamnia argentea]
MASGSNSKKATKGRQKIEIKKRENVDERRVTFTKRRTGLFDKAAELCILCGAEVVIITFSEGKKAFCFGHPGPDRILQGYLDGAAGVDPAGSGNNGRRGREGEGSSGSGGGDDAYLQNTRESKQRYLEAIERLEKEKADLKLMQGRGRADNEGFWWEEPIERMGLEELEFFHESLEKLARSVLVKLDPGRSQDSALMLQHDEATDVGWLAQDPSCSWPLPLGNDSRGQF